MDPDVNGEKIVFFQVSNDSQRFSKKIVGSYKGQKQIRFLAGSDHSEWIFWPGSGFHMTDIS